MSSKSTAKASSSKTTATSSQWPSTVSIRLPKVTIPAPWPFPYAPLTTFYTPPTSCLGRFTLIETEKDAKATHIGQYINVRDTNDAKCLAPNYGTDIWSATFSPGIYCPSGYTTAATGTQVFSASWEDGLSHPSDQKKAVCCLSGFNYGREGDLDVCTSTYDYSTSALIQESLTKSNLFIYTKYVQVGAGTAFGHPIHLRYNDEEFSKLYTGTPTVTPGSKGTIYLDSPGGSEGLSKGAIAGIAVGAAVGGLALIGLIVFFIMRHRRRKGAAKGSESGSVEMVEPSASPPPSPPPFAPAPVSWADATKDPTERDGDVGGGDRAEQDDRRRSRKSRR